MRSIVVTPAPAVAFVALEMYAGDVGVCVATGYSVIDSDWLAAYAATNLLVGETAALAHLGITDRRNTNAP